MTEQEWVACDDPVRMIRSVQGRGGSRRLRLWACAFNRWNRPDVGMLMRAVEVAESWAEGKKKGRTSDLLSGFIVCDKVACRAAERTAQSTTIWAESSHKRRALAYQVQTLRDIFGNPFRPATIDPVWLRWNDGTIPKLAQAIYDDRRFQDMPILADALEEAGCTNAEILEHCRSRGEHVRGCWVVDLLLGKK